uniref:Uncharacterized protein n=1 Tax=Cacopsylla melanoneura TaxID=428564 RepID=A0A8D9APH8_9HEMI
MTIVDEEKLQNCISRREIIFSRMQSLFDSTTKDLINNKDNLADFLVRYDRIEIHYVDFDSVQAEIFALCLKLKDTTTQLASLQQTTAFEDLYYRVRACARINNFRTTQEKLAEANKVAPSTSVSVTRESVAATPAFAQVRDSGFYR